MENKNQYFYSELEDQVIVNSVMSDFHARQNERKPYELSWELNLNYYIGNQYSYISNIGEIADIEKNYYWENRSVYNHIAPIIENRLAKLNKIKPDIAVAPATNSENDTLTAKLTSSIVKSTLNHNSFKDLINTATHWSEITGTVFYKLSWDNELGDIIGKTDDDVVKNGDVKISICSPFEIYPDSNSTLEIDDCESIIHARAVPISYVKSNWNVDINGEDLEVYQINNSANKLNSLKISHTLRNNQVLLIERYEKPNTINKNGKLTIVCNNKLLYDGELPYNIGSNMTKSYPFIKQVSIKQITSFWGLSVIDRCIPIQNAYNSIKNKKHEYISRLTSGVLTVEDGSVDVDNLENEGLAPGKILIYRNGSTPPQFLSPSTIPSDLEKEEENLLAELNNMCCVSDLTTNTSIPGNINSGSALNLLIEQEESRLSLTAEHIKEAIKKLCSKTIRLFKQFAVNIRLEKIVDANGLPEIFYWTNSNLNTDDVYFETTNELMESSEEKRNNIISLYEKGILFDSNGKLSTANKIKIFEILGLDFLDINNDIDELQKERAVNENLQIIELQKPLEIDNHKIHIDEHVKFIITNNTNSIDEEFKNKLLEHIKQHKTMI